LCLEYDLALHVIVDHDLAGERRLDPDDGLDAGRRLGRVAVAPIAVVARRLARSARLLAHFLELLGRAIAVIGLPAAQQLLRHLRMPGGARELEQRLAVPAETEPGETIEQRRDSSVR